MGKIKRISTEIQQQVALMSASGATTNKIHLATGLHSETVVNILKQPAVQEMKSTAAATLSEAFNSVARRSLDHITDAKLALSSAKDLGLLSAICVDKNRLISGQSTENIAVIISRHVRDLPLDPGPGIETDDDI